MYALVAAASRLVAESHDADKRLEGAGGFAVVVGGVFFIAAFFLMWIAIWTSTHGPD
jgi:hypothetical protein